MKYMGSKSKIQKYILPIILKDRIYNQWYVEPFAGGMNTICNVNGKRIANDINFYLIQMWKEIVNGWIPKIYTKEEHKDIRDNKDKYPPHEVGWVGFNCSYCGIFFQGYSGNTKTKLGTIRNYQDEAFNNVMKQINNMKEVVFENKEYYELSLPNNSLIYCDPPYYGVSNYKLCKFNSDDFWDWVREISRKGHTVFISEYSAPDDFECIWEKVVNSSLSANGKFGNNKTSIEKLFRLKK